MKINKMRQTLTALTLGLSLSCFGCCDDTGPDDSLDSGVGGSGTVTSTGSDGGSGGSGAGSVVGENPPGEYPDYIKNLDPSSEEMIALAECWIARNEELRSESTDFFKRPGIYYFSSGGMGCIDCEEQYQEFGQEFMKLVWDANIYRDCAHEHSKALCDKMMAVPFPTLIEFAPVVRTDSTPEEGIEVFENTIRTGKYTPKEKLHLFIEECPYGGN